MQGRFTSWRMGAVAVLTSGWLAGCGSGDGFPVGSGPGGLQPTFGSIQANVFTPICTQCHAGANAPRGLRLDSANSYALLVGVPSSEQPGLLRVDPLNPDASYLIQKLEGTAGTGERMPAGLPPLPQADIDMIREWIAAGALADAPQSSGPIRVTSLDPLPDSVLPTLPTAIRAVFDRDLNATTVDATTFHLVRSGGDGVFGDGNDVTVAAAGVAVPPTNPTTAVIDLTGIVSIEDDYRVTLEGAGPVVVLDLSGNALDGEFGGTFPSGNGAAGGDFVAAFEVAGIQPTLQSIQNNVLTPICAQCHTGAGPNLPASMNLTSVAASYASLVGVAGVGVPALQRVLAGNADDSYLIRKLEGAAGIFGVRMPAGGLPPLPQADIDVIRQWIDNGAPN